MAQLIQIKHRSRISEFERGRRIPSLITSLYYARIAGIPLESIVDDDIDPEAFRIQLVESNLSRDEIAPGDGPYWKK
jgi:transcriptional regulator with XRE-family HTH domain